MVPDTFFNSKPGRIPPRLRRPFVPQRHSYPEKISDNFRGRKVHRSTVARATWTDHGGKHLKARTLEEARNFSMGPHAEAQYLPNVNNKALEKLATIKGHVVVKQGNTIYFFYKFQKPIGYDGGVATNWIRAEISSGTLHGHPMRYERLPKEVRDSYRGIDL